MKTQIVIVRPAAARSHPHLQRSRSKAKKAARQHRNVMIAKHPHNLTKWRSQCQHLTDKKEHLSNRKRLTSALASQRRNRGILGITVKKRKSKLYKCLQEQSKSQVTSQQRQLSISRHRQEHAPSRTNPLQQSHLTKNLATKVTKMEAKTLTTQTRQSNRFRQPRRVSRLAVGSRLEGAAIIKMMAKLQQSRTRAQTEVN